MGYFLLVQFTCCVPRRCFQLDVEIFTLCFLCWRECLYYWLILLLSVDRTLCLLVLKCWAFVDVPRRGGDGGRGLCLRAMHPVSRALSGPARDHVRRAETGSHHVVRQDAHQRVASSGGRHQAGPHHGHRHLRPRHATQHQAGLVHTRRWPQKVFRIHRRPHQVSRLHHSNSNPVLSMKLIPYMGKNVKQGFLNLFFRQPWIFKISFGLQVWKNLWVFNKFVEMWY